MSGNRQPDSLEQGRMPPSAERLKAFTDAVVAIAMTLLILPLMESVSEASDDGISASAWLAEQSSQLFSFVLSFVLIANFWVMHHRMFYRIDKVTGALVWLTIAWMFTIVWLPVATSLVGQLETDDTQKVLYIGSMLATSLIMLLTRVYVGRHPELHSIPDTRLRAGLTADITLCVLFAVALALSIAVPSIGYFAMLLLLLTLPVTMWFGRRSRAGR